MTDYTDRATLKSWLKLPTASTSDDLLLDALITQASAFVDTYINRGLLSQSVTETYNGKGSYGIAVQCPPITAVTTVTVDNIPIPPVTNQVTYGWVNDDRFIYLARCQFHARHPKCDALLHRRLRRHPTRHRASDDRTCGVPLQGARSSTASRSPPFPPTSVPCSTAIVA
jgi:hypothetical protein